MKKTVLLAIMTILLICGCTKEMKITQKTSFGVKGKGKLSKKMIEKSALSIKGVVEADWNMNTTVINLKATDNLEDWMYVHKAIAEAGFDTESRKATQEAYDSLPQQCKYRIVHKNNINVKPQGNNIHVNTNSNVNVKPQDKTVTVHRKKNNTNTKPQDKTIKVHRKKKTN